MKRSILLFILSYPIALFAQSPWVNTNETYLQTMAGGLINYDQIFKGNQGKTIPLNGSITELRLQTYLEHGWNEKIATIVDIPLVRISSKVEDGRTSIRESGSVAGIGNLGIGAKYNFIKKKYLVTGQVMVRVPTYKSDEKSGLRTGFTTTSIVPTLSIGRGYNKAYFYAYTGAGWYGDDLSDDIRFGFEYGYHIKGKLWAIITLSSRESLKNGGRVYDDAFQDTYSYVNNQSFTNFAAKFIYEVNDHLVINLNRNIISVRANNLPVWAPFSTGVAYKFKKS